MSTVGACSNFFSIVMARKLYKQTKSIDIGIKTSHSFQFVQGNATANPVREMYNGKSYISKFSSKEVLWLVTELKGSAGSVPIIIRLILDLMDVASSYFWEGKSC